MRFIHAADCHIGGWKEEKLRELGIKSFEELVNQCISNQVEFLLISGDLFDTALPQIDLIKKTVALLKKINDHNIKVYIIPGSHDFSPSGKTMLDVLEKAGLVENVVKIEETENKIKLNFTYHNDVKITGLYGKKGGLEKSYYEILDKTNLESEPGFKIFMFHTALSEFKPAEMEKIDSMSVATLPDNFHYYAGGHVHYIFDKREGNKVITFPGALFPNNFKEVEEFGWGGYYLVNYENGQLNYQHIPIKLVDRIKFHFNVNNLTPEQVKEMVIRELNNQEITDKIVTLRFNGQLLTGKTSDIDFKFIFEQFNHAYIILKNTNKIKTKELNELQVELKSSDEIEYLIIKDTKTELFELSQEEIKDLIKQLMSVLDREKIEGEKNADFEDRLLNDLKNALPWLDNEN